MKTIIIYLIGYEPADPDKGGVAGFDWTPNKEEADQAHAKNIEDFADTNEFYRGELEVEVSDDYSGTEDQRVEITRRVEYFLELNDFENAFKEKKRHEINLEVKK